MGYLPHRPPGALAAIGLLGGRQDAPARFCPACGVAFYRSQGKSPQTNSPQQGTLLVRTLNTNSPQRGTLLYTVWVTEEGDFINAICEKCTDQSIRPNLHTHVMSNENQFPLKRVEGFCLKSENLLETQSLFASLPRPLAATAPMDSTAASVVVLASLYYVASRPRCEVPLLRRI